MNCYNTGQPGCQGDVRRTVAGRACCWPCGARLLAEAREGLTVRDYGDEQAEGAPSPYLWGCPRCGTHVRLPEAWPSSSALPSCGACGWPQATADAAVEPARAEALGGLPVSGGVKMMPGGPDMGLCWDCGAARRLGERCSVCGRGAGMGSPPPDPESELLARLASQAETIDRLVAEKNAMEQDRAAALLSAVALEGKVARLVEERDGLTRVYRDLADRLARAEGLTTADARREVAGAVRDEDRRVGAALARVLASISRVTVQTDTGGYVTGGWQGEGAAAVWHYGDAATPAEALEQLAEQLEQS
jgi:hypothetical protein